MKRKKINTETHYAVTRIGYCIGGDVEKARIMAKRAGRLRSDIWNKYGSLQAWGISHQELYKEFQKTNPPSMYQLPQKQWQKTFERVINDIHACQEAASTIVIRKIYRHFKPEKDKTGKDIHSTSFRGELIKSLKTQEWMQYPLLHRWMRKAYHRGHTYVNNQICVGISNGAKVERVSRNVVKITISGDLIKPRQYEKLTLLFKVGRVTPKGLFQIIFDDVQNEVRLHFPHIVKIKPASGEGKCGLDKGYTEAFTDSQNVTYGDGIGKVMERSVSKRHIRGKGRNKLYQIAIEKNKHHIFQCNLTKKRHQTSENRKKQTLNTMIRTGVNQFFDTYQHAITEDLSFVIKNKKMNRQVNRNLTEWCKGTLSLALEEISYRRSSSVTVVNAAYTSQVDSRYGVLLGTRSGDQFFTFDGKVLQADGNAGRNIEARLDDPHISRFMKSNEVREVLIKRTVSFLEQRDLTLDDAINLGWFNPRHLKGISKEAGGRSESPVA
ncbi:transposase IS605 OrfB [Gloeothece citriformis PCC 7424]|uniref:Transposase IS605 OrfB n=1 Tax=Gloeothece citriformis (strain PCC 7424) TaxID=65393 RepID=B7K7E8_GLOC7|nr:transposase [Gloeothece citriformis]ACK69716.1 transposase IS605 OrfB [Gloeothece citriformis PCC 7424]